MITLNRHKAEEIFNELRKYDNIQHHLLKASQKNLLLLRNKYLIGDSITSYELNVLFSYLVHMKSSKS